MAKTPEQMADAMVANCKEKTGKTVDQWVKIASKSGLKKHGEIVKSLKAEHGLTHGYANLVAHKTLKSDAGSASDGDSLIEAQYAGDKAALRPIYDTLIKIITGFGEDVELAPKKTYVSVRRNKQFAIIQPSTKTRVDVGINLKGTEPTARLEKSGSFNAMVSHRVRLESKSDVDAELKKWLKAAYEAA
ncbi:MAG: DUF4287 domain-containing protein [candidate division Zixibacteria bacterium]|nr:DUF4287 domain-containing protein [candidate division Zixibacteria bacterium]